jgi:hypothetical protein
LISIEETGRVGLPVNLEIRMNNRPIDKIRNSGMTMTLPEDVGGITDMCEINGSLHMIGPNAIYRVQLADEIDPKRTNIHIPNTNQKVLSHGTEFPYVRQTLMTAKRLFSNNVLGPTFDYKGAINLSFDALHDLIAMHTIHKELAGKLEEINERLKKLTVQQRSLAVPTAGNVRSLTDSYIQKADHVAIDLFNITKLFYANEIGKRWFESLYTLISRKYGDADGFTKFLNHVLPFLQFVRNTRNAMEHPDTTKSVKVTDILMSPSGELNPPCIEVIHPETPQTSLNLLTMFQHMTDHLASVFELMIAYLCGRHIQPRAGLELQIIEYDANQQKAYKCRHGYGALMGTQIVPFG